MKLNKDMSTVKNKYKKDIASIKKDHKASKKKLKRDLGLQIKENIKLSKIMDKGNINIDYCSFSSEISVVEDVNMEVISKANNSDISSVDLDEPCASGISNALCQVSTYPSMCPATAISSSTASSNTYTE